MTTESTVTWPAKDGWNREIAGCEALESREYCLLLEIDLSSIDIKSESSRSRSALGTQHDLLVYIIHCIFNGGFCFATATGPLSA